MGPSGVMSSVFGLSRSTADFADSSTLHEFHDYEPPEPQPTASRPIHPGFPRGNQDQDQDQDQYQEMYYSRQRAELESRLQADKREELGSNPWSRDRQRLEEALLEEAPQRRYGAPRPKADATAQVPRLALTNAERRMNRALERG